MQIRTVLKFIFFMFHFFARVMIGMDKHMEAENIYNGAWDDENASQPLVVEAENDNTDWDVESVEHNITSDDVDENNLPHMVIKHESLRIALVRQEKAARTEEDFENLTVTWDRLDRNREQREQRYEKASTEDLKDFSLNEHQNIIPTPLEHTWWRELLRGDFINIIHDCPMTIHEFTTSQNIYCLVRNLKDTQKEVLYYRAIRYWSNQKIAAMRGQTDRNILKTYETLIESLRYKLYMQLFHRFMGDLPLTINQRIFMKINWAKYGEGKPKRKRRTKAEIEKVEIDGEKSK